MNETTYKGVFGGVKAGIAASEARAKLVELYKVRPEKIDALLSQPGLVLWTGVPFDLAKQYKQAIESAGVIVRLMPERLGELGGELAKRAPYDAELLSRQSAKSVETRNVGGAVYPDDVLQDIARELVMFHTFTTLTMADEFDPRLSSALWTEVECFVLYVIESAVRASEQLHPSSRSRLAHLLIEEWASEKPSPNPSSGIVARAIVSLVIKTGFSAKLFRYEYGQLRTSCDSFLNSSIRKAAPKDYDDLKALTFFFFSLDCFRDGRTQKGRPMRFGGTNGEIERLYAHVADCFARAGQCIRNRAY